MWTLKGKIVLNRNFVNGPPSLPKSYISKSVCSLRATRVVILTPPPPPIIDAFSVELNKKVGFKCCAGVLSCVAALWYVNTRVNKSSMGENGNIGMTTQSSHSMLLTRDIISTCQMAEDKAKWNASARSPLLPAVPFYACQNIYSAIFQYYSPWCVCVCVLTNLLYLVVYIDSLKCFYTTCEDKKLQGC